jgi:ATP-binding cassette subfamily C exporter for protease/lipase
MYGDPSVIVLDEPNSNLDDAGEAALVAAIQDLRQRGKTIVLITHRTSIIGITTKLLFMRDGVAQMYGPTADVLKAMQANQQQAQAAAQQHAEAEARRIGALAGTATATEQG